MTFEQPKPAQPYDFNTQNRRQNQFADTPLQPGATRQSYQDSDIFQNKGNTETVQKSAMMTKEMRERGQNTYTPSNVMGNQEHAHKNTDKEFSYGLNKKTGNVARDEAKWQSNVFAAPQ